MNISSQDLFSIVGWLVSLFLGYRFVNRRRHPNRNPMEAFLLFIGIFGGITITGLLVFVGISALFDEKAEPLIIRSLSGFLVLAVVIPAWKFGVSRISSAPSPGRSTKDAGDHAESLTREILALSPSERESLANDLESLAATKESAELYTTIVEQAQTALKLFKGWLTLELVYETFTTLHHAGGMDLEAVARTNRVVMTQAESLQALVVQWRTLNPKAEDRTIDTLKRACEAVLTSGHVMKTLIARRRSELNPNAVPTAEDAELLSQLDRCRAFVEQNA